MKWERDPAREGGREGCIGLLGVIMSKKYSNVCQFFGGGDQQKRNVRRSTMKKQHKKREKEKKRQ